MKTLIVKGSGGGGLGDSIRVVLTAILYAKASGRALFVDWRDGTFGPAGENAFNQLFHLKDVETVDCIPETNSVHPVAWHLRSQKSLSQVYMEDGCPPWNRADALTTYSADLSRIDHPQEVLFMWDFDQLAGLKPNLSIELRTKSDQELLGIAFKRHLIVTDEIRALVARSWTFCGDEPVIGVHVRMTDEYSAAKGSTTLSQYCSAIKRLRRKFPKAVIFLATDNLECQRAISNQFGAVYTRPKWFNSPGQPLHLSGDCPDRAEATRDALVELLLLSRCDYLVRPQNSSFSLVAAIIGGSHQIKEWLIFHHVPFLVRLARLFERWKRVWLR